MTRRALLGIIATGSVALAAALSGCGQADADDGNRGAGSVAPARSAVGETTSSSSAADSARAASSAADASAPSASGHSAAAVVYLSMPLTSAPDLDAESGASVWVREDGSMVGLNQALAQYVSARTGTDLIRIVPQDGWYPADTPENLIDFALDEQDADTRPPYSLAYDDDALPVESLAGYSTLYIGYPIWWYEPPMVTDTFFESEDLAGKQVHVFVEHGGSGLSGTPDDIRAMQPDADVADDGLSVNRRDVASRGEQGVDEWLAAMGAADA